MIIPKWIISMLITSITVIMVSKYVLGYLEIKDTNEAIKYNECLIHNIEQLKCDKIIGVGE